MNLKIVLQNVNKINIKHLRAFYGNIEIQINGVFASQLRDLLLLPFTLTYFILFSKIFIKK